MKISGRQRRKASIKFNKFIEIGRHEIHPINRRLKDHLGVDALTWFIMNESQGLNPETKHPLIVESIVTGRSIHGMTKDMYIESLKEGTVTTFEVKENFSESDASDILNRYEKIITKK